MFENIKRVQLNITQKCFANCKFCHMANMQGELVNATFKERFLGEEITADDVIRTLKDLITIKYSFECLTSKKTPFEIVITGGEPLLRYKDCSKMIKFFKLCNIPVELRTNGFLIENAEQFLKDFPADVITISIEGDNEEYNDMIRGPKGHFKKISKIAPELRKIIDKKNLKIVLKSATVLTKHTHGRTKELEAFFKSIGFMFCDFGFLMYTTGDDYKTGKEKSDELKPCPAKKWSNLIIDSIGNIFPCFGGALYQKDFFPERYELFNIKRNRLYEYTKFKEYKIVKDYLKICDESQDWCDTSQAGCYT